MENKTVKHMCATLCIDKYVKKKAFDKICRGHALRITIKTVILILFITGTWRNLYKPDRRWLLALGIITTVVVATAAVQAADMGKIQSGETKSGNIVISGQMDSYTFYGIAGQGIDIEMAANNSNLGPAIDLLNPNGIVENSKVGGYNGKRVRMQNHTLKQTGSYTIVSKASGASYTDPTGAYDLALVIIPGATSSAQDPNGGNISSGQTHSANIYPAGDTDAFAFYGKAGHGVVIEMAASSSNVGPAIYLYGPNGFLEKYIIGGYNVKRIRMENYTLKQTGKYTIVSSASWSSYTNPTGAYGLSLVLIPGATSSPQDLDGGDIVSGQTYSAAIAPSGDTDAFAFSGKAGEGVDIKMAASSSNVGPAIYLYSPKGFLEKYIIGGYNVKSVEIKNYTLKQTGVYTVVSSASWSSYTDPVGKYGISFIKIPSTRYGIYNPYPPDKANVTNLNQSFRWNSTIPDATSYNLYFGEDVIIPLEKIGDNLSLPTMPFPKMVWNKTYYWHVEARTSNGIIQGPYWWFKAAITPITAITVTTPNGGEVWQAGTTKTIRWMYSGDPGSYVKIELLKGGVVNSNISLSTRTSNGSYDWKINSTQTPGIDYKVKITSTTNPAYKDTSNGNFTIVAPCNISTIYGYKFNDTNNSKTKDIGEVGLSNWTINLKGYNTCTRTLVSATIKTNATGYFAFKNINAGTYILSEDFVLGWLPTTDAAYTLRVPSNSVSIRKDFGNKKFI